MKIAVFGATILSCALLGASVAAHAGGTYAERVRLDFRAAYPANLYWVVNALAGDEHTESASYRKFWAEKAGDDPADAHHLDTFRAIRAIYRGSCLEEPDDGNGFVPVPPSDDADLTTKFAALFLSSDTLAESFAKAEILLRDRDAERLKAVFNHFDRRFQKVWKEQTHLAAIAREMRSRSEEVALGDILGRAAVLYGVPAPELPAVRVSLVLAAPGPITHGRALGRNLVVEVRPGERARNRLDVVAHETCHFLYELGGMGADPGFLGKLFGKRAWYAGAAFGLVNEGVATAIGQGVVAERADPAEFARTRSKPGGWYVDGAIDPFAKAVFPAVKESLAGGKTLRDLAPAILDAYAMTFPAASASPRFFLNSYVLAARDPRGKHLQAYFEAVPPRSLWRMDIPDLPGMLRKYAAVSAVVAATRRDAGDLVAGRDDLGLSQADAERIGRAEPGLITLRRPVHGYVFVVLGQDETDLGQAMARFGRMQRITEGWQPL